MFNIPRRKRSRDHGFTLVEIMVAVLIIGILSAISIPAFAGVQTAAQKATVKSDVRNTVSNIAGFIAANPTAEFVDTAALTVSEGNCVVVIGSFADYTVEGASYSVPDWGIHFAAERGTYQEQTEETCTDEASATPTPTEDPLPSEEPVAPSPEPTPSEEPAPTTPEAEQPEAEILPAPTAPQNLTATASDGNRIVLFRWGSAEGATSYQVDYDLCMAGNNCHEGDANTTATQYTLTSSAFGSTRPITSYTVAVTTVNDNGTSSAAIIKKSSNNK